MSKEKKPPEEKTFPLYLSQHSAHSGTYLLLSEMCSLSKVTGLTVPSQQGRSGGFKLLRHSKIDTGRAVIFWTAPPGVPPLAPPKLFSPKQHRSQITKFVFWPTCRASVQHYLSATVAWYSVCW